MTAQTSSKPISGKLTTVDKARAVDLRLNAGLTCQEIADILKVSKQAIHQQLLKLIPTEHTEIYKNHRADILSHAQLRLLSALTDDKIKKMAGRDLVVSAGILYDKERLERDLSTSNVDVIERDIAALKGLRGKPGPQDVVIEAVNDAR